MMVTVLEQCCRYASLTTFPLHSTAVLVRPSHIPPFTCLLCSLTVWEWLVWLDCWRSTESWKATMHDANRMCFWGAGESLSYRLGKGTKCKHPRWKWILEVTNELLATGTIGNKLSIIIMIHYPDKRSCWHYTQNICQGPTVLRFHFTSPI